MASQDDKQMLVDMKPGEPPATLLCSERLLPTLQQATPPHSHIAEYSGTPGRNVCLLEVDEEQLQEIMLGRVQIKGRAEDEAVLCTKSKTWALKAVYTTNRLLLVPASLCGGESLASLLSKEGSEVDEALSSSARLAPAVAVATSHIELLPAAPRLLRLKEMLHARPYSSEAAEGPCSDEQCAAQAEVSRDEGGVSGDDARFDDALQSHGHSSRGVSRHEATSNSTFGVSFDEVLEVQASEEEVRQGLASLRAVEIDGRWCVVAEEEMAELLHALLLTATARGWPVARLPEAECLAVGRSRGFCAEVVLHCLKVHSRGRHEGRDRTGKAEAFWEIDETSVCVHYAKKLLASGRKWKAADFLLAWEAAVPPATVPSLEMLRGLLVQLPGLGAEPVLRYVPPESLPPDPAARFQFLFSIQPRWLLADLEPFLLDLQGPGASLEKLLFVHTRKIQETADATPLYCAR